MAVLRPFFIDRTTPGTTPRWVDSGYLVGLLRLVLGVSAFSHSDLGLHLKRLFFLDRIPILRSCLGEKYSFLFQVKSLARAQTISLSKVKEIKNMVCEEHLARAADFSLKFFQDFWFLGYIMHSYTYHMIHLHFWATDSSMTSWFLDFNQFPEATVNDILSAALALAIQRYFREVIRLLHFLKCIGL